MCKPPPVVIRLGRLRKKDRDDPSGGPVKCAEIDADGYWKPVEKPAGRKDPPGGGGGQVDGHGEARGEPPWILVEGKSSGSRVLRSG